MGWLNRRPKRAAILGCGPAGLFAAHAFALAGWEIVIYSRKVRSELFGAQYLLAPIPGLMTSQTSVQYRLNGTWADSTRKVYGQDAPEPQQTWDEYIATRKVAWDIRKSYCDAWSLYNDRIIHVDNINPDFIIGEFRNTHARANWGAVVSTIPAPAICHRPNLHAFTSVSLWASGDAPEKDLWCPISCDPDTVICDGTPDRAWYRISNIFGHTTAEWPDDRRPPISNLALVRRPMGTNCDCWPTIARAGRYGAWNKSAFSHQAFELAAKLAER